MAWRREDDDGRQLMITFADVELGSAADADKAEWIVGRYGSPDEDVCYISVVAITLGDALRIADMMPKPAPDQQDTLEASQFPKLGDRFELTADVERYPHFIAKAGRRGTITEIGDFGETWGKLDEKLEGAEGWDNCVVWDVRGLDDAPFYTEAKVLPR